MDRTANFVNGIKDKNTHLTLPSLIEWDAIKRWKITSEKELGGDSIFTCSFVHTCVKVNE